MDRLFWAKLRGYPWWPAIIENFDGASYSKSDEKNQQQVPIRFLGSHDFAIVAKSNLKPFLEHWQQYANKGSSSKFKLALKEAQDYVTLPIIGKNKKKLRGRPPKSVVLLKEKKSKLIQYSEKKLTVIFGRQRLKKRELVVAARILYVLSLLEEEELKEGLVHGRVVFATAVALLRAPSSDIEVHLRERLLGCASRLDSFFV